MSSTFGENLKLSIFGQSHGVGIGMTLDGIPAGLSLDIPALHSFLARRAPGRDAYSTSRCEGDAFEILSGVMDGYTCGAPIAALIRNSDTRSDDYQHLKDCPRPGHADYTAQMKYGGFQDYAGGGHFSGRLTAPLCIAGGMCLQWLEAMHIHIRAHIQQIGTIVDGPIQLNPCNPVLSQIQTNFPVVNTEAAQRMIAAIADAKRSGDSLGGIIQCFVIGLPAGLGEPMFGGIENRISQIIYGIPAVKGVEFGEGFGVASLTGSQNNDCFTFENGNVRTTTNHCGGILGGISNGMPIVFQVAVKPTPSISMEQQSVSLAQKTITSLKVRGRHDPCIVPRAVPVIEAATAIAIYDLILGNTQVDRGI